MFLSTHPSRSATQLESAIIAKGSFYPRTPRGVRRLKQSRNSNNKWFLSTHPSRSATYAVCLYITCIVVSIHAPLAECDHCIWWQPWRRKVSIHAPLAECDYEERNVHRLHSSFYPRTPRGVRHQQHRLHPVRSGFLSTHPSRSAT